MTDISTVIEKQLRIQGKVTDKNVETITGDLAIDVLTLPGSSKPMAVKQEEDEDATKLKDMLTDLKSTYTHNNIHGQMQPPHDGELLFFRKHIFRLRNQGVR